MKHNKLISIIVPVYNRRKELQRCLLSLQKQTHPYFEVLAIDDSSDIPIKDIIDSLKDSRFKYLRNNKNGGPYNARTVGWKVCKGDYVVNIDSDCEAFPWMLERIIFYFDKFSEAAAITGMYLRNSDSKMYLRVLNGYRLVTPKEAGFLPRLPDAVGAVKHFIIDEWLQKSHDYFATESHQWLTFFLKHIQLYVDEPWVKLYSGLPDSVTLLSRKNFTRLVNDCLLFLNDHDEILRTNFCPRIDEELINVFIILLRGKHWNGARKACQYMRIRHKNIAIIVIKVLMGKLFRKFRRFIWQKKDSTKAIWI